MKIFKNICLIIAGIIIAFSFIEIFARIFYKGEAIVLPLYKLEPNIGPVLKKNISLKMKSKEFNVDIKTNSYGLRDNEFNIENYKIILLGLGDSFTFGSGVELEKTYLKIAEKIINEDEQQIICINAGQPATGTYHQYLLAEKYIKLFKPKIVTLGFFFGNDFIDNFYNKNRYTCNSDGFLITNSKKSILLNIKNFIYSNFYSLRIISENMSKIPQLKFLFHKIINKKSKLSQSDFYTANSNEKIYYAFNSTIEYIKKINKLCQKYNIKFIIILIPDKIQIDNALWYNYKKIMFTNNKKIDRYYYYNKLVNSLSKLKISYIDMLPVLRNAEKNKIKTYFARDPHWTKYSHKLAGIRLSKYLIKEYINNGEK